jgi:predicted GNAT superfamily acetyltransferase
MHESVTLNSKETRDITIRRLANTDEYVAAEQLQQDCWQSGPIEAVPLHMMITLQKEGGLVLGAFTPEGRLVGFVLGFLGREGAGLKHCSHMAAVHPDYSNHNIAWRLKMAQREILLAEGLEVCTWTFDPLESRNATLNIAKLGAISRTYKRHIYGQMRDGLNALLPTDRLQVRWELNSGRVRQCAEMDRRVDAPVAAGALTQVAVRDGVPVLAGTQSGWEGRTIGIQIPREFQPIKREHPDVAMDWRMGTRALFEAAFAGGYTVVNVTADPDNPALLTRYTLQLL